MKRICGLIISISMLILVSCAGNTESASYSTVKNIESEIETNGWEILKRAGLTDNGHALKYTQAYYDLLSLYGFDEYFVDIFNERLALDDDYIIFENIINHTTEVYIIYLNLPSKYETIGIQGTVEIWVDYDSGKVLSGAIILYGGSDMIQLRMGTKYSDAIPVLDSLE